MGVVNGVAVSLLRRALVEPRPGASEAEDIAYMRGGRTEEAPPGRWVRAWAQIDTLHVAGRPVLRLRRKGAARTGDQLIYWHGGSWTAPMLPIHWLIIAELQRRSGADVWVPAYGLLPEATLDDALGLMGELSPRVAAEAAGRRFVVAGDSSGGHLSLVQAQADRDAGRRVPDHLLLYAPATDLSFSNPEALALEPRDPMTRLAPLHTAARLFAAGRPLDHPLVSPLHADPAGFPPISLFQGELDVLAPDNRLFAERVRAAGGIIDYREDAGAPHVHVGGLITREARSILAQSALAIRGDAARTDPVNSPRV